MTPADISENTIAMIEAADSAGMLHDSAEQVIVMLRSLGNSMDMETDSEETFTMTFNLSQFMALVAIFTLGVEAFNVMFAEEDED